MKENIIQQKSYAFAIRIVNLCKHLRDDKREFVLYKQVLRSGTAIGALVEEAIGGQSDKDFIAKMSIAYKEARETQYWLRLLTDTGYLEAKASESIINDCEELLKIITAILNTMKNK